MDQEDSNTRDISNNRFGDNVTINQVDVHNHASDQENQCLKDLRSTDPRDDKMRIQNTNGGLLRGSYCWVLENEKFKDWRDNAQNRILWIKGNPGKGKTMLLCGIIDELMPKTKLAKSTDQTTNTTLLSYFFCQGTDRRINNATAVLRGLIYLIIAQEPSLISHVLEKYDHAGKDLFSDVNAWVALSDIFAAILQDPKMKEVILVIDALDECEADLSKLLDVIVQQFEFSHIKCIVSSRNILGIQQRLESYIPQGILNLEQKGNASCVSEAVDAYIKHSISRLTSIQGEYGVQENLRKLVQQKANGTFLWVSLVMKELQEVEVWEVMEVVADMPTDLVALYNRMMHRINSLRRRNKRLCKNLLSAIFTAYYPLSLAEVGVVAGIPDHISGSLESIAKLVTMCGSFLTINEDKVYFIHQSAKDFLSTEIHSTDAAKRHLDVFKQSVAAISKLSKNIYGLTDFGPRPEDAQPPDPNPLASMRYSCFYWANHLCDTCNASSEDEAQLIINETLKPFLNNHVLRWIESLSLLDGLLEGMRSMRKLLRELPRDKNIQLSSILSSIEVFILRNGALIAKSPLQVYGSALIFSPVHGHMKATQWGEKLPFIKNIQGIATDGFLKTLKGHTRRVEALAISPNGEMLASKSRDKTLCCWDVATGALDWKVQCHDYDASAIAFSPDNRILLLATCVNPMLGRDTTESEKENAKWDDYWIRYITLSPASGIPDASHAARLVVERAVRLNWSSLTIDCHCDVAALAFSSDCKTLASGLASGLILLWDATTGACLQIIQGHDDEIQAIAVSPDGGKIASGSRRILRLWDAATGAHLGELDMADYTFTIGFFTRNGIIQAITFCQDGENLLLSLKGVENSVWDPSLGILIQTCVGKDDSVITISPDNKILASASRKIQLWDAAIGMQEKGESNHFVDACRLFAFTPDGKAMACAKSNIAQIWDTTTGECCRTIEDNWRNDSTDIWEDARCNYSAIAISANGKSLAVGGWYGSWKAIALQCQIQIWDAMTGECTCRKPMIREQVSGFAFSSDGSKLAIGFEPGTILLLDIVKGGWLWEVDYSHSFRPRCLAFSPDNSMLASAHYHPSEAKTYQINLWDTATGKHRQRFAGKIPDEQRYNHIIFSPDGRHLYLEHQYRVRLFEDDDQIVSLDADLSKDIQGQGIPITDGWVTQNRRRLLWIPEEYRNQCAFVYGSTVILGHGAGITFIWLDLVDARRCDRE